MIFEIIVFSVLIASISALIIWGLKNDKLKQYEYTFKQAFKRWSKKKILQKDFKTRKMNRNVT